MAPIARLKFLDGSYIYVKSVHPCMYIHCTRRSSMHSVSIKLCNQYLVCILISDMHATFPINPVPPGNPNTVWCGSYYAAVSNLLSFPNQQESGRCYCFPRASLEHLTLLTVQNISHDIPIWRQLMAAHNALVSTDLRDLLRPIKPPKASACMSEAHRMFGSRNCSSTSNENIQKPQNS